MAETPTRILVVEDDLSILTGVSMNLRYEGYEVLQAQDGKVGLQKAIDARPDLIVLDVMLPGFDGIEVCRQVRSFSDAYIIMLTARDSEVDKVLGLSMGADDYLVKPFSPRELIARVHAMLRRPRAAVDPGPADALTVGGLVVDLESREVHVDGTLIELTRTEFDLLAAMAARPKAALTRRQLIDAVWGPGWFGDEHVVDVHVGHVRTKLGDDASEPRFVRTVRGVGYGMGPG
jgi:DNA-binding response OmpR family regulator